MQLYRYTTKKYALHKTSWGRPHMARLRSAARAIFGPPGIFKWEGLAVTLAVWRYWFGSRYGWNAWDEAKGGRENWFNFRIGMEVEYMYFGSDLHTHARARARTHTHTHTHLRAHTRTRAYTHTITHSLTHSLVCIHVHCALHKDVIMYDYITSLKVK